MACSTCGNQETALAQSAQRSDAAARFEALPVVRMRYMGQHVETMWLGRYLINRSAPDTFVASVDVAVLLNVVIGGVPQFMFVSRAEAEQWLTLSGSVLVVDAICVEPKPKPDTLTSPE